MKRNAMRKNLRQSIIKSFGRYIAIVAIIALGASIFVGLLMSKADMVATGQKFVDEQNMFDLRLICNYGWAEAQLTAFSQAEGIEDVEGIRYQDLICDMEGEKENIVYRFYGMPETMNRIALRGGRLPEKGNECVIYGFGRDESVLGSTIHISDGNEEDALDAVRYREFTVVGFVATPLYMDFNYGTTTVGNGTLESIIYVPGSALDMDYYSEIHMTLPGNHVIYSDAYNDVLEAAADSLEDLAEKLSEERYADIKEEAENEYQDGLQEYEDGVKEYEEGVLELQDAYEELKDAELKITYNKNKLRDAGFEIRKNWAKLEDGQAALEAKRGDVQKAEAMIPGLEADLAEKTKTLAPIQADADTLAALQKELETAEDADKLAILGKIQPILAKYGGDIRPAYEAAYKDYAIAKGTLDEVKRQINEFYTNEAKINGGFAELLKYQEEIDKGWNELHDAEKELQEGWEEYEDGKQELADAEIELADAEIELADAREELDSMEEPQAHVLDRNSNIGYNSLSSSSDIVAGVSRIIPVFFLLVAALVCITTMTRMIDEERTQIGTLKALGYSNAAIINKYLMYAGTGAVLGCGLGVLAGNVIFPKILWQAYGIMLYIDPQIVITFHWPLMIAVVTAYTIVMLSVTWYCCRRTLQEEPAELIRPKAPDVGKKVFLEYLPFWHKISFLNKVTIRNIFRYRQRLAMMLVGIGGCTALLLTGFGLRDSIVNVVDYQFEEVTVYDLEVYFEDALSGVEQHTFLREISDISEDALICHKSGMDILWENQTREVYMIAADAKLRNYFNLTDGGETIPMPGKNQVVLSKGITEILGVEVGDTIHLRDADMQILELTVSGIYMNHLYNYAIVAPVTLKEQWGALPEQQVAFVKLTDRQNAYELGTEVSQMDNVMNVSVSEDLANMVSNMMEALDLVILLVVFCAGLLAVIVLYNLTNININERIREIATIKVLGFNASETAAYVFKENIVLTVTGSLFGLLLGNLLLAFVMTQIKIDMIWFKTMIMLNSYWWSIGLTILSAIVVNFIFYFKLDKINMAEALKSVE